MDVEKKKKSESSVISHCVPTSFGVCECDTAPEHIFRPRDLFFNQWPPLPGSRDTPPQDFISVSEHNWLVSSLEGGGIMQGKNIAAQSLFKDFWSKWFNTLLIFLDFSHLFGIYFMKWNLIVELLFNQCKALQLSSLA